MSTLSQVLLSAAAAATAVGVLWRFLHLGEVLRGTRLFLVDWFGQPERPGAAAVPGFPERMATVESRTADLAHDFRGDLTSRLTLLAYTVDQLHIHSTDARDYMVRLDERVTDHRRRNEEAIRLLSEAVARQEERLEEVRKRGQQHRATDPKEKP